MLRTIGLLLAAIILIPIIRSVIGVIAKSFLSMMNPETTPGTHRSPAGPPKGGSFGGELRRDPVCGTYISESTAVTKQVDGETYYFCSPACRDKFNG